MKCENKNSVLVLTMLKKSFSLQHNHEQSYHLFCTTAVQQISKQKEKKSPLKKLRMLKMSSVDQFIHTTANTLVLLRKYMNKCYSLKWIKHTKHHLSILRTEQRHTRTPPHQWTARRAAVGRHRSL